MRKSKSEIVTFKVDHTLQKALGEIPNKSQFIRHAVLAALDSRCPLCAGTGTLTANQRRHWDAFCAAHHLVKCSDCRELHIVCVHEKGGSTECERT